MNAVHLALKHGLTIAAVRKRLQRGKPLNDPPQRRTVVNRSVSIAETAKRYGLPYEVAKKRMARGIPLDAPYTEKPNAERVKPSLWPADPLNALFSAWRTVTPLGDQHMKARI